MSDEIDVRVMHTSQYGKIFEKHFLVILKSNIVSYNEKQIFIIKSSMFSPSKA